MLRVLSFAAAMAFAACPRIVAAQDVPATDPAVPAATSADPDGMAATTPGADQGSSAADDPLAAARSAMAQARALANQQSFQQGIQHQRSNASALDKQPLTTPHFDLHSPQPIGREAISDATAPPARQWATSNRQPLLILVSFSMPDSELQELATQGARIGAPLVLRGLIDDSFPVTQKRLMKFRQIRGASFRVDPTVFRRFNVTDVPTFVLPLEPLQTCSMQSCPAPAHVAMSGEAGVDFVLDEFDRRSDDPRTHPLVQQLRAQFSAQETP